MLRHFKKYLIPHKGNKHHPHILRNEAIVFILAFVFMAELAFLAARVILPGSSFFSAILPGVLVQAANNERQTPLTVNPLLERAAQLKANDMVSKSYFAHTSPTGVTPWYWLGQVGYKYEAAGENLAINFLDSSDVHTAWMNSPTHRANIVSQGYTEIGIATAQGKYQGYDTIFVVQFFGKPKSTIAITKSTTQAAKFEPTINPTPTRSPKVAAAVAPSAFPVAIQETPVPEVQQPTFVSSVVASPRKSLSKVLIVIGGVIVLALALTIFVRKEFPRPGLVIKPLFVVLVIASILVINNYLSTVNASISALL